MKKIGLLLSLACMASFLHAQTGSYWQQQVNYKIDVTLHAQEKTLDAFERLEYTNHSPDTLRFIWFHCWPNAYKNDRTAFSDQMLENGNTKFYFSDPEQRGYLNRLDFKVDGATAETEDHPHYSDIIKLLLPTPLAPGQTAIITTPFHVKLPFNFSRGGYDGESFQVTQWYPKPAVYDRNGWHPIPYLDQGEFYSEFGSFDVSITVPENYVVAATGVLQDESEKAWLLNKAAEARPAPVQPAKKPGMPVKKPTTPAAPPPPAAPVATKTLHYKLDRIHDFAWFANKDFLVAHKSIELSSGKPVDVFAFYTAEEAPYWNAATGYAEQAIRFYSGNVGEYPYPVLSVVQGPQSFGGGMEYPTITVISPIHNGGSLNRVMAHEIGHNWFYGILASNERQYPWMDEGINSFYESWYSQLADHHYNQRAEDAALDQYVHEKLDQPINTAADSFSVVNYQLVAYYKTSKWMAELKKELGDGPFNAAMKEYYNNWSFKHPQPADFKASLEKSTGKNLDQQFALLDSTGRLPSDVRKGVSVTGPMGLGIEDFTKRQSVIKILPAIGFNSYDKFMIGAAVTNVGPPANSFTFLLTPMYATGSKTIAGLGFVNYSFYPKGLIRKIDLGVSGARFSDNRFIDPDGKKLIFNFTKVVPGIRFTQREKNPRSTFYRFVEFKSYLFREQNLQFSRDSIITPTDTTIVDNYGKNTASRTLNQLRLVIENNRALYPYSGELKVEQGKNFARAAFTGNYFFNYPKEGGLNVRLFAGKFFYTQSKTTSLQFATDRYHLNMTGANGYEDYTYSDYFVGRNLFQGFGSQQIMVRDGGFKVRTDLLADKVGRSDDWLVATNFTTSVPSAINPLSLLPVKIPLKIFADVGTYSDAWKPGSGLDRFIFDAGLQLSVLKVVHFYMPLVYSGIFRDYIQSTLPKKGRIWKTVSFAIDISNFSLRKVNRNLNF